MSIFGPQERNDDDPITGAEQVCCCDKGKLSGPMHYSECDGIALPFMGSMEFPNCNYPPQVEECNEMRVNELSKGQHSYPPPYELAPETCHGCYDTFKPKFDKAVDKFCDCHDKAEECYESEIFGDNDPNASPPKDSSSENGCNCEEYEVYEKQGTNLATGVEMWDWEPRWKICCNSGVGGCREFTKTSSAEGKDVCYAGTDDKGYKSEEACKGALNEEFKKFNEGMTKKKPGFEGHNPLHDLPQFFQDTHDCCMYKKGLGCSPDGKPSSDRASCGVAKWGKVDKLAQDWADCLNNVGKNDPNYPEGCYGPCIECAEDDLYPPNTGWNEEGYDETGEFGNIWHPPDPDDFPCDPPATCPSQKPQKHK